MKKPIIILIILLIVIIAPLTLMIAQYRAEQNEIKQFNSKFEEYLDKDIWGTDVASLINYAIDNNEKYEIEKDENRKYIDDDKYCVKVQIKLESAGEEEELIEYDMETIASLGTERFVMNFNLLKFKCTEIIYNSYGRVSKIFFEIDE